MARPLKQTVDYFPHDGHASDGDTLTILEGLFGNDGYAFWFKLLERLSTTENHVIDCRNPVKWQLLLAKTHITEEKGLAILNRLASLEAIDSCLWTHKIIWCQKFVDRISEVYKNRRCVVPTKPVITDDNQVSHQETPISTTENTQSKLKETKVNNTETVVSVGALKLSELLKAEILKNNPQCKVPTNLKKWAREIDRMVKLDKRIPQDIQEVIIFCQHDIFWKANILSTKKLREKYDQLYVKMKSNGNGHKEFGNARAQSSSECERRDGESEEEFTNRKWGVGVPLN